MESDKQYQMLEQRFKLLRSISELKSESPDYQGQEKILQYSVDILSKDLEYCCVWVGKKRNGEDLVIPLLMASSSEYSTTECLKLLGRHLIERKSNNCASQAIDAGKPCIVRDIKQSDMTDALKSIAKLTGFQSSASWPLFSDPENIMVLTILSINQHGFCGVELDYISSVVSDISLALRVDQTAKRLRRERDFNSEIVDTLQALLVSLTPCGNILSFNQKAREITGFEEIEVKGKYWVDVLITPEKRRESQNMLSGLLKDGGSDMNFQTELQTRHGEKRIIRWHASIQPDIEQGQVGLVLFGRDVTKKVVTDRELDNALAKWDNIFTMMQDPALVVSEKGVILDINPATAYAARKPNHDLIGKGVCEILHGGRSPRAVCPLETLLMQKKSRIFETELIGLQGNYLLTVSPLKEYEGKTGAALLMAKNLSEEQLMKAEALRAAQLASIGELAAGVAHEVNNPINGIINYAQILKDTVESGTSSNYIDRILKESKRVAGITKNLLDFARKREETPERVNVSTLLQHCVALVEHQYHIDGITIEQQYQQNLADVICNPQQMQQVFLNLFSNARYALNNRTSDRNDKKLLIIDAVPKIINNQENIRLSITDNGTGIEHDIIDRILDPFFSTKGSGEGTGLGLSISHGLVKDNKGLLRIQSEWGKYTTIKIYLPVVSNHKTH